jgi:RalA-binding protein 1
VSSTNETTNGENPLKATQSSVPPSSHQTFSAMAGPASERAEPVRNPPRNSSIDSSISTISTRSGLTKAAVDAAGPEDIAHLIKTAGSAEAVIQYLLKEKQSQSQQNAQLWRLVDKQRAMILGLNKDLERALKDKEKYRKKLKEVLEASGAPLVPAGSAPNAPPGIDSKQPEPAASTSPKERILEVPLSPTSVEPEAPKHSPVDMALAPYPITPPANQPAPPVEPQASVAEVLDPSHSMPKASEFALNNYDPDAQEREAEAASKRAEEAKDFPVNLAIPPSRTAPRDPREPPRNPPPQAPAGLPNRSPKPEDPTAAFPPPPAPPPRKPPPAPLHLHNAKPKPNDVRGDSPESDTDYDAILEVPEEKRGRRRTREEDDRERAILAAKEAELRSLSKKSKKSSSRKASEQVDAVSTDVPASPRLAQATMSSAIPREPASLAGVLSGAQDQRSLAPAIMSPGLPASPRPMGLRSPPLSPMGVGFPAVPLSPRPPRGPIPLPPNTPLHTPSPGEPAALKSPRPQQIRQEEAFNAPSPTKSTMDSPVERTKIYRGFVTEEYPDLLLPPNALPSIDIKVASSRMKPSRASLISLTQLEEDPVFTLAVYSRADGGELWRIEKDTASLAKLDQRLKQCPNFTAKTPDRSLFSGHAPAKLDARRNALNQYLDELLNTPLDNATALELCKYLSTNTLPPNADETGSSTDSNSESQRTGPGGRPYRSGYLTKRGKNFGGWKARYFVLDGPMLKYYETPGGAHLGTIKLKGAQIGKQAHHNNDGSAQGSTDDGGDNQYRHAFLILEPKKKDPNSVTKHVLCAESDKERDQWVDALLRWIDYRDPEDEESPKKEHASDRTQERGNGKKKQGKQQPQRDEENLIGVSYETTRQGDIPQGVPTRGKSGDHESTHSMSTTSSFTISAPRDPQIISNTEAWGSKLGMGLAPPTQEEKKARKRSFFGFGPKPRTSSDGQESLFGSDSSTLAGLQQQLQQQYGSSGGGGGGSNRQAFGASLAEAVRYNPPSDVRVPLPAVVYRCIQYLDAKNAIFEEGIFRLSGSNVVIKQLRERFNNEGDINLLEDGQFYDIHAIASLLKLYLRELPSTILTNELRGHFIAVTEMTDHKEKMKALAELVERLPQANAALLKYLIAFLIKIIDHSDVNKMTVRNVGIVFSPTLNIPAPVFAMFLQNYEAIFGIHPSEYELPVVEPDLQPPPPRQERRPSLPSAFQERRPSDARPSTSHGDSPHRQRLMEALEAGNRSTPTPPPMTMQQMAQMNAANMHARSTPTPPPQRPLHPSASEPSLGMGPGLVQQTSMRPAYEGNYAMPPAGYENLQVQMNKPVAPAYDRPLYENGLTPAPYDSTYRSRRESAMFMGTLSQQGSKSRLREEAQF